MADINGFEFVLKVFSTALPVTDISKFHFNKEHDIIAIINYPDSFHLREIKSGRVFSLCVDDKQPTDTIILPPPSSSRFSWVEQQVNQHCPQLIILGKNSIFHRFVVISDERETKSILRLQPCGQWDSQDCFSSLAHCEGDVDELERQTRILCCHGDVVTCLRDDVVITVELQPKLSPRLSSSFHLGQMDNVLAVKAIGSNGVIVLKNVGFIDVWDIITGQKVASVDLTDISAFNKPGTNWTTLFAADLTSDLNILVLFWLDGHQEFADLEKYFRDHPSAIYAQNVNTALKAGFLSSGASSSQSGQKPWYEKAGLELLKSNDYRGTDTGKHSELTPTSSCAIGKRFLKMPFSTRGLILEEMCCDNGAAYAWLKDPNQTGQFLCATDIRTGSVSTYRLPVKTGALLYVADNMIPFYISETSLHAVAFNEIQKQEVLKLMQLDKGSSSDDRQETDWRSQSVAPIHVLEASLANRQLDTVALFLKSWENIFDAALGDDESRSDLPRDTEDALRQLRVTIQTLTRTIKKDLMDSQTRVFAKQLVKLLLNYLHMLTRGVVAKLQQLQLVGSSCKNYEKETDGILTVLTDYSMEAKELDETPGRTRDTVLPRARDSSSLSFAMSDEQRRMVQTWNTLDEKVVIVEGVQKGQIPLLQAYLSKRYGPESSDLTRLINAGLEEALAFLQEREMKYATQLFANMGFNVPTKLRQICFYTPDKSLREYLTQELIKQGQLTEDEVKMVDFLKQLESLYSCPSFEVAKLLRTEGQESRWEANTDMSDLVEHKSTLDLSVQRGDIVFSDISNAETADYSQCLLEWVRTWDMDTRHRILLEIAFRRHDSSAVVSVPAVVIWDYLCCHLDLPRLQQWIDHQLSAQVADSGKVSWPYYHPIKSPMLQSLKNCPPFFADLVLDQLARRGVFSQSELMNWRHLVSRLSRLGATIQQPHVLQLKPQTHQVLLVDFHYHMIKYCIDHQMPQLLFFYLDFWQLCVGAVDLGEVGMTQSNLPHWCDMMLHFRRAADLHFDPQCVFEASLANSRFLSQMQGSLCENILYEGNVGRTIATLVYMPDKMKEFLNSPSQRVKESLQEFPRLYQALFSKETDRSTQDITVYDLLKNNAPFDPRKLFGWQSSNELAGEKAPRVLPHFSDQDLMKKYGHCETLQFKYYLKQGRPCYAFWSFLIDQLQAGAQTISAKRIQQAYIEAHLLAVRRFQEISTTAACVGFVEMLGRDSTAIRLYVHIANLVYQRQCGELIHDDKKRGEINIRKRLVYILEGCVRRRKTLVAEMLSLLVPAVTWYIQKQKIKSTSFEYGQKWLPALMFCKYHGVPMTTQMLADCASQGDWLMFLVYSQLYQFSASQLSELLQLFSSSSLQEHLQQVLQNLQRQSPARGGVATGEYTKDIRTQLYNRIGVERSKKDVDSSSSNSDEEDNDSFIEVDLVESQLDSETDSDLPSELQMLDVFSLLFACQNTTSPWRNLCTCAVRYRNPIFAVLAACYKDHCDLQCLGTWLVASLPDTVYTEMCNTTVGLETECWSADKLLDYISPLLKHSSLKTLQTGLKIFFPDCILLGFLEFHRALLRHQPLSACKNFLEQFKTAHSQLQKTESSESVLPLKWVEQCVVLIVTDSLSNDNISHYVIGTLLTCMDEVNVTRSFTSTAPDLSSLHRFHRITVDSGIRLNYSTLVKRQGALHTKECERVVRELETKRRFNEARLFAAIAELPIHSITVAQLQNEKGELMRSEVWNKPETRAGFWKHCRELLNRHAVQPVMSSNFFQQQTNSCKKHSETSFVWSLAYECLEQDDSTNMADQKMKTFASLWQSRIRERLHSGDHGSVSTKDVFQFIDDEPYKGGFPKTELLNTDRLPNQSCDILLSTEEARALDVLLGRLLNRGHVTEACKVAACFSHYSQDVLIVVTCLRLAHGLIKVEDIDKNLKTLLAVPGQRSRRMSTSLVTLPRIGSTLSVSSLALQSEETAEEDPSLSAIQMLTQRCTHGRQLCSFVLVAHRIAMVLKESFTWMIEQDHFHILSTLLTSSIGQYRFGLAKTFITTSGISDSQVAGFLCDAILESLQVHAGIISLLSTSSGIEKPLFLTSSADTAMSGSSGITELIQLCNDPAVLGQRLLDAMLSLASSNKQASPKLMAVEVDLLLYAHDCYTLACHMEGISAVLTAARTLTTALHDAKEYRLMVGLLIGLGRFSEMTYVFNILKQEEQFELLFRRGKDKDSRLRLAILDYLKRHHPGDSETYTMVALHFTMFREIAQLLEEAANKLLTALTVKPLENNPETQKILQNALHNFSDAAENYVRYVFREITDKVTDWFHSLKYHFNQEGCLRQAQSCVKQARLVALQTQLLSTGIQVINLNTAALRNFVATHSKFYEAYIVCEAYSCSTFWVAGIFRHVVEGGDFKYLHDYRAHLGLKPALIAEVAERFQEGKQLNKQCSSNMKKLLSYCSDIQLAFKLATQLNFACTQKELLDGESGPYLKDMIPGLAQDFRS